MIPTEGTMKKAREQIKNMDVGKIDPMKVAAFAQIDTLQDRVDKLEKALELAIAALVNANPIDFPLDELRAVRNNEAPD